VDDKGISSMKSVDRLSADMPPSLFELSESCRGPTLRFSVKPIAKHKWRAEGMYLTNSLSMCINTHMDSRMIIKMLQKDGWYKADQSGSHIQFRHQSKKGRVTVPHPKKDIPIGTLKSIERQAGIKFK